MREIIFDTETTGFEPFPRDKGTLADRIVEIGAIEIVNLKPTGKVFHKYINPERPIPAEVVKIHGIDDARVKDCPTFKEIVDEWLEFIGDDAKLVAHNASFDMKFVNAELLWSGHKALDYSRVVDTLPIARSQFPGQRATLDALCNRFGVDNSGRTYHGALLDSELLLDVYIELRGGKQRGFELLKSADTSAINFSENTREKRVFTPSQEELEIHAKFLEKIKDPIWNK